MRPLRSLVKYHFCLRSINYKCQYYVNLVYYLRYIVMDNAVGRWPVGSAIVKASVYFLVFAVPSSR